MLHLKCKFILEKIQHLNDNLEASVSFIAKDEKSSQISGLAQIFRKLSIRYKNQAELAISKDSLQVFHVSCPLIFY